MIPGFGARKRFTDLDDQQMLALAISSEEDDASIYRTYAERLRGEYPASAAVFDGMAEEEDTHRRRLIEVHKTRFGDTIPLIRREHVSGYYARRPIWLVENLQPRPDARRGRGDGASGRDLLPRRRRAAPTDADTRKLLGDLAAAEAGHSRKGRPAGRPSFSTPKRAARRTAPRIASSC